MGDTRRDEDAPDVSSFFGFMSSLVSAGVTGKGEGAAEEATSVS
jgi:hypothetical protein